MFRIIVASHGKFAEELVNSSYMVFGKQENVSSVGFYPGEGIEDLRKKYETAMCGGKCGECMILVDIFGGSPFNVAVEMADRYEHVHICTGVNLGMLIEAYSHMDGSAGDQAAAAVCNSGKDSITVYQETDEEEDEL